MGFNPSARPDPVRVEANNRYGFLEIEFDGSDLYNVIASAWLDGLITGGEKLLFQRRVDAVFDKIDHLRHVAENRIASERWIERNVVEPPQGVAP